MRRTAIALLIGSLAIGSAPLVPIALAQDVRSNVSAQSAQALSEQADALVADHMRRQNILGLSLAVVRRGIPIKTGGYGIADQTARTKVTAETVFNIGSISKQFIASAIMLLLQDGKLALGDRARAYLKDAPEAWDGITIRQLLSHTSGLVRDPPPYSRRATLPAAHHIRRSFGLPLAFNPGDDLLYSNLGYFVLAEIIEVVSGNSWSEFLSERIFKPAGLAQTQPYDTPRSAKATGYVYRSGKHVVAVGFAVPRPSGGIQSSVLDLARWDATLHGNGVLTQASRSAMWTPTRLNNGKAVEYGLGWVLPASVEPRAIQHSGHVPGFGAYIMRQPEAGLTIIVLANADAPQTKLTQLTLRLRNLYSSPSTRN